MNIAAKFINDRGAKDYLRIKKEYLPRQDKMARGLTKDGIEFKVSRDKYAKQE